MINHAFKTIIHNILELKWNKAHEKTRERQPMLVTEFTPPGLRLRTRFNWNMDHFHSLYKIFWDLLISDLHKIFLLLQ
jgi:hypothetical protein